VSKLSQLLGEMQTRVSTIYPSATIAYETGRRWLASNEDPAPRVVWVPTRDTFGPVRRTQDNPRPRRARNITFEAHVWGTDLDQAEAILEAIVLAGLQTAQGSVEFEDAKWDAPEWITAGEYVVLTMSLATQITDPPIATTTITAVADDPTGATPGDGALQCGEQ
jgi:hypothetical protein